MPVWAEVTRAGTILRVEFDQLLVERQLDPGNWVGVAHNRRFVASFMDSVGLNCVGRPIYGAPDPTTPYVSYVPPPFDVESWMHVPAEAFSFFPLHVFP